MKKTKISKRKIITISSIVIALGAIIFVSLFFVFSSLNNKPSTNRKLVDYKEYNSNQTYIKTSGESKNDIYISISSINSSTTIAENNIITISTAEELYKFSELCYNDSKFLEYKYELLCNIDFDDYKTNDFIPIGCNGTAFSGEFNGNGYEIKNLELINLTSANVSTYSEMTYFAMFSSVTGSVTDFGLIDPIITIAALSEKIINNGGVSYIVGSNAGTVSNVFVKCLSTTLLDECGITAAGGYRISGLCVTNSGTITDSYIATNSIYNYTLTDVVEFADIAITNSGTITDCYFYNTSIDSTSTQVTNGAYNFIFVSDLGGITKSGNNYYGTMIKSLDDLNTEFKNKNWTVKTSLKDSTNEISDYYSNETPIHRGFANSVTFADNSYTIKISNVKDFLFMFELMNGNNYFASSAIKYLLTSDLNLDGIPAKTYAYKSSFGASFEGEDVNGSVTLIDGSQKYHTIYNADLTNSDRKHTVSGIDAYGLFPYLIGNVSKINIVTTANLDNITQSNNVKAIGAVCGYSEGGVIDSVNVMLNATLSSSTNIGEYYLGGITGILGGEGGIIKSTATGEFELSKNENYTANTSYMGGVCVGGVVGYIEDSLGYVDTCLNATNITIGLGASATYAVGGVIGAGYTTAKNDTIKTQKLENLGKIIISDFTKATSATGTTTYSSTKYDVLYAAGVIGRLLGQTEQVQMLVNQGNVELYGSNSNNLTMLAGVMNADVRSKAVANTNISQSLFKDKNGNTLFYASSLTNRANVKILSATSNLVYTSVLNITSSNGIKSSVSNIYNLNNNNIYRNNKTTRTLKKLDDFSIDISKAYTYAACLNAVGSTNTYDVNVNTIYNLRNINYSNEEEFTTTDTLRYSAIALGDNVTINSGKNEGNITFNLNNNVTANIMSVGIIDNVGASSTLYDIYNGGNMTLDSDVLITGNLYFSGICYSNNHEYTTSELNKFNPLSTSYDTTAIGAIDNVINKGDILITNSTQYKEITFTPVPVFNLSTSNKYGNTVIAEDYQIENRPTNIVAGNINISGIAFINKSVINNTFNLGNLTGVNYVINGTSTTINNNEINVGGFSVFNVGSESYILNSANNGIIKSINLYGKEKHAYNDANGNGEAGNKHTITTDEYGSILAESKNINASGISVRNDKVITNGVISDYDGGSNHAQQMISFTINYGSVFAYSNGTNITSASEEPSCKASGILALGLCNVINTVNYGNIYGSESAAGIFGVVYFSKFTSDVSSSNKVNIANSINYGNVYQLDKGQNAYRYEDSFRATYEDLISFTDEKINNMGKRNNENIYTKLEGNISDGKIWGLPAKCTKTTYTNVTPIFARTNIELSTVREYWTGSIFSLVNFNNDSNAQNVVIRYLISFNTEIPIEGNESGYSNAAASTDVTKIYSSYHTTSGGNDVFSQYMGKNVSYAPLTTTSEKINGETYIGIFNKNFEFRRAINGDSEVLDNTIASDKLLSDYFQFVVYNKINDYILDKIGWRSMAYSNAATLFATDLSNVKVYYDTYSTINSTQYSEDVKNALNVGTWVINSEAKLLQELVEKYTDEKSTTDLVELLEYIFSDKCMYSIVVNDSFRADIIKYLVEENDLSSIFDSSLINFTNGYAKVLAATLSDSTTNDVYSNLKTNLNDYISKVDGVTKQSLLLAYASYLSSSNGDEFFNNTSNYARYDLLKNIFASVEDDSFYTTLYSVFSDANKTTIDSPSDNVSVYSAYSALTDSDKIALFKNIISNNTPAVIENYLNACATDINLFAELNNKYSDYSLSSFDDILTSSGNASVIESDSFADKTTIDNRVSLWNKLRTTDTFKTYLNSLMSNTTFYAHATEHKNTWMSNTGEEIGLDGKLGFYANYSATDTVTSDTIFFGPYDYDKTNNKYITIRDKKTIYPNNDKVNNNNASTYNLSYQNNANEFYLSLFMTTEEDMFTKDIYSGKTYTQYKFVYDYGVGNNQFDGYETLTNYVSDLSGTYLKEGETFTFGSGSAAVEITTKSGAYVGRFNYAGNSSSATSNQIVTIYDGNNTYDRTISYSDWMNIIDNYAIIYYFALPTTTVSDQLTGLYMYQKPWSNTANYFNVNAYTVYTTHYIDYSIDDLLSVDGVCSVESNNSTEYERDIINRIFEEYLLTSNNISDFKQIVKKALFESLQTINDQDNITFVDNIISTAIGKELIFGSGTSQTTKEVLEYLAYSTTDSTTTSVKDYLSSTSTSTKEKILNAAATNKDVFCELLYLLFDTTLTSGADTSWTPSSGTSANYGGNFDVSVLYERLIKIKTNKDSEESSNSLPNISTENDYYTIASGNKIPLTVDPNSNYTGSDACEIVSSENIGYFTGNQNKINYKAINFSDPLNTPDDMQNGSYKDSNGNTPADNKKTPRQLFKIIGPNGNYQANNISPLSETEFLNLPTDIQNLIPSKNSSVSHYMIRLQQRYPGSIMSGSDNDKWSNLGSISYYGQTYENVYLPNNGIWFKPKKTGKIRMILYTGSDGACFSLVRIKRNNTTKDNPFYYDETSSNTQISGEVLGSNNNIYNTNLPKYLLTYFEYDVTDSDLDYEFYLTGGDSGGAYFLYLDIGQNGSDEQQETANKTNYIQNQFKDYADNALNKLVPYVTPLYGGTLAMGDYNIYAPATTYDSNITYYERKGSGTSTNPYTYSKVTDQSTITSDNVTKYYVDTGKTILDYQNVVFNEDFIKLLGKYSNEIIVNAINSIQNSENISADKKKEILSGLVGRSVDNSYLIFNAIISGYETDSNGSKLSDDYKMWLASGYLATDYYHNLTLNLGLQNTLLNTELPDLGTDCDYIDDSGNIIPANFENFKKKIGLDYQDDGYGIFALASGKGIQNGTFIPDNLDLSSMDPYYNNLAKDEDSNTIISLTDDKNTSWRGLTGNSTSSNYDVTNSNSVNYAFKTEMKQLKKSISTTIFELDLIYSNSEIIHAGSNEITSNTITYYLPQSYIDSLITKYNVSVDYVIADSATLSTNDSGYIDFTKLTQNSDGNYVLTDAVTVTAEDETVVQKYDIIVVPTTLSFEIEGVTTNYTDSSKLNYTGGKVTLNIKTKNMPNGFNFSNYLTIANGDSDLSSHWDIDESFDNNGIVSNDSATLVVDVLSSMPGGTLTFTLSAFGTTKTKEVEKIKNTEALIKSFKFEGSDLTSEFSSSNEVESTIKFGRAYNYDELTKFTDSSFYLYEFSYSDNANVSVSAKMVDYGSGRIQYVVTYTITPEDGSDAKTYTHKLTESDYFADELTYANVYKDGISQNNDDLYQIEFTDDDNTLNTDTNKSSITYKTDGTNFIALAYNRGLSPEYRIKYNLANFYTLDGVTYSHSSNTIAEKTSITDSYRGLTVSVSDEFSPGVYKYEYKYSRSGTWDNNETYNREYTFPAIYIVKLLSTDSLLNRLTFIDSSIMLGNTATVMKTNTSTSTSIVQTKSEGISFDGNEVTYNELFTSSSRDIEIKGRSISYNNNSDATSISDYYAIGTVSDSDLSYYCPTFGIEDHAQIYQYTTINKLKNYGENQSVSDSKILTDHSDRLLYVPFVKNYQITVFLVLIDENGNWISVYDTDYNGSDEKYLKHTYTSNFTTLDATTSENANFDGYTIDSRAGKVNDNQSLYMDYIGNPCENHFWFVSYMVFSESALNGDFSSGNIRYYHISIIDATNTVYFEVELYAPESLSLSSLYLTISENIYNDLGVKTSQQISGYLNKTEETNDDGLYKYTLGIKLQTLPKGYFYFYIDLPQGYSAKVTADMLNQLDKTASPGSNEEGSFLPFTSIVPKTIKLTFTVSEGDNAGNGSWGLTTTDIVTVKAELEEASSSKN